MKITIKFRLTRKLCEILQLNPWEKSSKALYWRVREVLKKGRIQEYQPSGARGHSLTARNAAPPATPHRLQNVFNVGFSIVLNIGFNIRFNIGFNIGFNVGFNIAKSKMAARGPQNGRRGLEMVPTLGYWALPSTFAKEVFWSEQLRISTNQRPRNPKWPPGGPKMADGVWKGVQP